MLSDKRFIYGILLALAIALPIIFSNDYIRSLFALTFIFAAATLSLDLIITRMGQFTFGHQAFFAIGAYTSAILYVKLGTTPFLGFLAAIVVSGLVGGIIGFVALRSTRGSYLAIVTLGSAIILRQIFSYFVDFTGGVQGLIDVAPPVINFFNLFDMVFKTDISYYYLALLLLLLTIYLIIRWQRSRFGRAAVALGENETLANSIGISPLKVYTMTFALASAIAGLCGALFAHYLRYVSPQLFDLSYMLKMMVILFVGGPGTIGGPILGSLIFIFLPELLPTSEKFDLVIIGIILLVFILYMPRGVYPALRSLGKNLIQRLSIQGKA